MNRTLTIAGGIAVFSAGLLAGLFLRRGSSEPGSRPAPELQRAPSNPEDKPASEAPRPAAEVARLENRIRELEMELKSVRGSAAKPASEMTPAALEELFKAYLELTHDKNADPEKARILFGRLSQLDEKSAGYFIDRFRKSVGEDSEDEREIAMELAMVCGGAAAADFVNVLLNDASLDNLVRANLLMDLSGTNGSLFSIRRLPINEALGSTAMTLCRSSNTEDRKGGAGLLGGVKSEVSRTELRRLIEEDKDLAVRTSAILSLGHVGDQVSRTFLERLWITPETKPPPGQSLMKFRNAIESALKELAEGPR